MRVDALLPPPPQPCLLGGRGQEESPGSKRPAACVQSYHKKGQVLAHRPRKEFLFFQRRVCVCAYCLVLRTCTCAAPPETADGRGRIEILGTRKKRERESEKEGRKDRDKWCGWWVGRGEIERETERETFEKDGERKGNFFYTLRNERGDWRRGCEIYLGFLYYYK